MRRMTKLRGKATRATLGAMSGVHPSRVGGLENGRIVPPPGSVELQRIADALGYEGDPSELLEEVPSDD